MRETGVTTPLREAPPGELVCGGVLYELNVCASTKLFGIVQCLSMRNQLHLVLQWNVHRLLHQMPVTNLAKHQ